jgi:hypothetical protein
VTILRENVDICKRMYLVIQCDKTTVHEITDCSSVIKAYYFVYYIICFNLENYMTTYCS